MQVEMHPPISEAIRVWLTTYIEDCRPRLCSEFSEIDSEKLFEIVLKLLSEWGNGIFLVSVTVEDIRTTTMVDQQSLAKELRKHFGIGDTVSILDPTNGSGCTIDWEAYEEDPQVLIVPWGKHESMAQKLVDQFGCGKVFRGN